MALLVTENWSAETYSPGASAKRQWTVTDADSMAAAADAVVAAAENATHYLDMSLKAGPPDVSRLGPARSYIVEASYSPGDPVENNPATYPVEYFSDFDTAEEAFDKDGNGTPILNSAGDVYENLPTRTELDIVLTVRRREAIYYPSRAKAFVRRVNRSALSISARGTFGGGTYAAGEAVLRSYRPVESMKAEQKFVTVEYVFVIRDGGWNYRVMDLGYRGWFGTPAAPGKITENGKAVAFPVRLDGSGKPLNATFKVEGQTAVACPTTIPVPVERNGDLAVFLKYTRYESVDFSGLQLF